MADVKIVLNSAGVRELLKSSGVGKFCESKAAQMTRATGMPYVTDVYVGRTRVNAGAKTRGNKK